MKKFKKSIEISTENISDVLQVPIVTSVYKTKFFKNPFIEGRSNPYDALAVMYVHVEGIKSDLCINQGDVLALDICDTWYAFSKAGWEKHKTMRYEEEMILRIWKRNLPFEALGTHR